MGSTQVTGRRGEDLAQDYLFEEGFELLHRNWRSGRYELDLVAMRGGILHIVEVKSRKARALTSPEEAMTRTKFESLCHAVRHYVAFYNLDMEIQFDLIAIEFMGDSTHILRYYPDVMSPRW